MRCFDNIAKLIRTKRINHPKGYSQSELSHLLGYKNGQFISNVERALCNIPLKMIRRVSEVLDIEPDEIKGSILKDQEATLDSYLAIDSVSEKLNGASNKEEETTEQSNLTPFHMSSAS